MEPTFFAPRIADSRRRAEMIAAQAGGQPGAAGCLVGDTIAELNTALEELRVADEELRRQNAQLEDSVQRAAADHRHYYELFEFAPIGLLLTDSDGVIREANRAAALLFSCERHHLIGKPVVSLLHADSAGPLREQLARVLHLAGPLTACAITAPGRDVARRVDLMLQADAPEGRTEDRARGRRIRWAIRTAASPEHEPRAAMIGDPEPAPSAPPTRAIPDGSKVDDRRRLLFDLEGALGRQPARDRREIEPLVPHRGAMLLLDRVLWTSDGFDRGVAIKHVRADEFWVDGHVPGNPVMPCTLMVEAGAQLACFLHSSRLGHAQQAAFARLERATFRGAVRPGDDLYLLGASMRWTPKRFVCDIQGVVRRRIVFESRIAGVAIRPSGGQ